MLPTQWNSPRSPARAGLRRLALLGLLVLSAGSLAGCSLWDSVTGGDSTEDKDAQYRERPSSRSMTTPGSDRGHNWQAAAKQFDEVDRQHPYSVWARRAMLMWAYCYYQANKYTDAISTADNYI